MWLQGAATHLPVHGVGEQDLVLPAGVDLLRRRAAGLWQGAGPLHRLQVWPQADKGAAVSAVHHGGVSGIGCHCTTMTEQQPSSHYTTVPA